MHALPRLALCAPLALALSACSFSADDDGFRFQIGPESGDQRHRASVEREIALELAAGDVLVLEGVHGDVTVRAAEDQAPSLSARIVAAAATEREAEDLVRGARLEARRADRALSVDVLGIDRGLADGMRASLSTDLDATVPHGVSVRVISVSGEVSVVGPVAAVEARTSFGDVRVDRAGGGVEAKSGSGEIELARIQGERVVADTDFGDVRLEVVEAGSVVASSSSGDLSLRDVRARTISATSRFGDVEIEGVEGDVTAQTASGDLDLRRAARGTHEVHSGFGAVEVEDAAGVVRASSDSGDVEVGGAQGEVEAKSGFGAVEVSGVLERVVAESSSGRVEVKAAPGSVAKAEWRLSSRFGELRLVIPDGFGCELELTTAFGSIETEIALAERHEAGPGDRARATVGSGGPRVVLDTASGDVEVEVQR